MPNLGVVYKIMNEIMEADENLQTKYMHAEHDEIYLPKPNSWSEEKAEQKAKEWDITYDGESFQIFV